MVEFTGLKAQKGPLAAKPASLHSAVKASTTKVSAQGHKEVTTCKQKVAINGFGRIGRNFLRCLHGRENSELEVVVVNDSGGVKQATHLLKYDSMLGTFDADVRIIDDTHFAVNGKEITVVSNRDPLQLPWKELASSSTQKELESI